MANIYRLNKSHEAYMSDEYVLHISHMTSEKLHSKSDIALELACRDMEIERLQKQLKEKGE
jgi:hypothetical protein